MTNQVNRAIITKADFSTRGVRLYIGRPLVQIRESAVVNSSLRMKTGRACAAVKSEGEKACPNDKITEPHKYTNDGGNPSVYQKKRVFLILSFFA